MSPDKSIEHLTQGWDSPKTEFAERLVSNPSLRTLMNASHGLSPDSLSLLADMAGRLRVVEGLLMTTEY